MKKTALILAVILIVCFTGTVSADDNMQSVLISVKDRVDIPERCTEFSSDIYNYDGVTTYDFSWSYSYGNEFESYGVNADNDGIITSLSHYNNSDYDDYEGGKVIPKISKEEAVSLADGFMARLNPGIADEYKVVDATYSGERYLVEYDRIVNGIPTPDYAHIWIDGKSGELRMFSLSYAKDMKFQSLDGVIDTDEAKKAFKDGGALTKEYCSFGDDKTARIVYDITDLYMINAFTGKKYEPSSEEEYSFGSMRDYASNDAMAQKSTALTPEEISVLEEIDGLMTEKDLEEKLLSMTELGLKGAVVTNTSLVKEKERNESYYMNLSLEKKDEYYWARMDAQTGRLNEFYGYGYSEKPEPADDFIKKYYPEYIDRTEISKSGYRVRVENGIMYPQNSIIAEKDSKSGRVIYFSMDFDEDIAFNSPEGIIDGDRAYEIMYNAVLPELSYEYDGKKAVPVYTLSLYYFTYIDAATGELLNYMGEPVADQEQAEYTYDDIAGHFAEEAIKTLGGIGVGFNGGLFKPDEIITQKDFAALVAQCIYDYVIYKNGGSVDTDETARYCIQRGIIKKDEYYPDEPLTREKALEILLKAMNFERAATIEGIFKVNYADASNIDPVLYGYVAIASGLKLVQGTDGYFFPKENLTRGQAAVIIYNYLNKA